MVADGTGEKAATLQRLMGKIKAILAFTHDIEAEKSASAQAWLADGEAQVMGALVKRLPQALKLPADQQAVADKILVALSDHNHGRLTNRELADCLGVAEETISRALERLRQRRLVDSWRIGRSKINSLTSEGRTEAREVRQRDRLQPPQEVSSVASHVRKALFMSQSPPVPVDGIRPIFGYKVLPVSYDTYGGLIETAGIAIAKSLFTDTLDNPYAAVGLGAGDTAKARTGDLRNPGHMPILLNTPTPGPATAALKATFNG